MNITDIRFTLEQNERASVKAYVTLVVDGWLVIKDVRLIQCNGRMVVAMPNKELRSRASCGHLNPRTASYCSTCGQPIAKQARKEATYADVAHPVNGTARQRMEKQLLEAYFIQQNEATRSIPSPKHHRVASKSG